eukprot:gene1160-2252_t
MALAVDLSAKKSVNLSTLQRQDVNITGIISESSHIAIYRFEPKLGKWDRFGVEGAAFITKRNIAPLHNLIVLNRSEPNDFKLDLSTVTKIKLQPPYVMIRCSTDSAPLILGLWFHDVSERDDMMQAINSVLQQKEDIKVKTSSTVSSSTTAPTLATTVTNGKARGDKDMPTDGDISSLPKTASAAPKLRTNASPSPQGTSQAPPGTSVLKLLSSAFNAKASTATAALMSIPESPQSSPAATGGDITPVNKSKAASSSSNNTNQKTAAGQTTVSPTVLMSPSDFTGRPLCIPKSGSSTPALTGPVLARLLQGLASDPEVMEVLARRVHAISVDNS